MPFNKEDYTVRVTNASPFQLMLINLELVVQNIREAAGAFKSENIAEFENRLTNAREFLNLLMTSLDMSYDVSKELMRVYIYVNGLLINAGISKSTEKAETAAELIGKLYESFEAAVKAEAGSNTDAVMQNAQQVYAGLTYKNGKLSEYIDENTERGFKA